MHVVIRREDVELRPVVSEHVSGLLRADLVGAFNGSTHTGFSLIELADGSVDCHLHSFETSFYVLSGEPVLVLEDQAWRLTPGACGAIPVGARHAWRADGAARWLEMASPCPRGDAGPADTFWIGPAPDAEPAPCLDVEPPDGGDAGG